MDIEEALSRLGLANSLETISPGWEESQRLLPAGEIEFLTPEYVRAACAQFRVGADGADAAVAMARRIAGDAALRAYAWHYHRVLYGCATLDWGRVHHWPAPEAALGSEAGIFCTVVFLSGLPRMRAEHRAHQVPAEVVRETLSDVGLGLDSGQCGMRPDDVQWFAEFLRGELYRLGRLQFQRGTFGADLRVFRHASSGAVLALAGHGVRFRRDGQLARKGDADGSWTAALDISEAGAVGYPILPTGRAMPQSVSLPATEWQQVLGRSDPALNIHIPGDWPNGPPMDHDACGQSISRARAFFPQHYPHHQFLAFCCWSWVLNTWLGEVLPPTSNMRRFQEEMYLFPTWVDTQELVQAAFHELPSDLTQAPRDTTLQRAILEVLQSGRTLEAGGGGCFLLWEDVRWGKQVYRRQEFPAEVHAALEIG
ncbi:MAG: acyltransferase domain-containing protein [Armatimonadota bacterium]